MNIENDITMCYTLRIEPRARYADNTVAYLAFYVAREKNVQRKTKLREY